jgi:iron complex transport system substrate-binding protein
MTRADLWHASWLALLALCVSLVATRGRGSANSAPPSLSLRLGATPKASELVDASGSAVPVRAYRRVASGSSVADDLLLALLEPERIVGLTSYGRSHARAPHLYGARLATERTSQVEELKSAGVELLVLHHFGPRAELARLRDAGIAVFDLGEMRGLASLREDLTTLARLLACPERAAPIDAALSRRMRAVASDVPRASRKRALYVSAYGGQLFGGTRGTSYHDVLEAAGLVDAAAERYRDWPHYDPEELLTLDPEVIVTAESARSSLCETSGLAHLSACADGGRGVIGVPDGVMSSPGFAMIDAAEAVHDAVYGAP